MLANGKLEKLLETWQQEGEHFTGVIFITRGERREEKYDPENDVWVTRKIIDGDAGLIFKTERQGTLLIELTEKGFNWARGTSYRFGGVAAFKISESVTKRIQAKKLMKLFEEQRSYAYAPGSAYDYASFAYRIFLELEKNDGVVVLERNGIPLENCAVDDGKIRIVSNIRSLKADDLIVAYSDREDTLNIYDHQVRHRVNEPEGMVELNKKMPIFVKLETGVKTSGGAASGASGANSVLGRNPFAGGSGPSGSAEADIQKTSGGGVTTYATTRSAPKPKGGVLS